jgi:hypothetical protein
MIQLSLTSLKIINYSMFPLIENSKSSFHKLLSYLSLHFDNSSLFSISNDLNVEDILALSYNKSNIIYSIYFDNSVNSEYIRNKDNIYSIKTRNIIDFLNIFKDKLLESPLIYLSKNLKDEDINKICDMLIDLKYEGIIISDFNIKHNKEFFSIFINDFSNKINIINNIEDITFFIQNINYTNRKRNINLYFSYYKDKDDNRQKELDRCLEINMTNPLFQKVIIINENKNSDFIQDIINKHKINTKIIVIDVDHRYKFYDFFNLSNTFISKTDDINVLINTDIIIGKGFSHLKLDDNKIICLTRHDITNENSVIITCGGGSHDCWIWKGKIKCDNVGDFYMGKYLCDGVLANQLHNKGYILKNPIYGLFTYHYHISNVRNYSIYNYSDIIKGCRKGIYFSNNDNMFSKSLIYEDGCN